MRIRSLLITVIAVTSLVQRNADALVRGDLRALDDVWAQNDVALYEDDMLRNELTEETGGKQRRASGVGSAIVEMRADDWKLVHWHVSTAEGAANEGVPRP